MRYLLSLLLAVFVASTPTAAAAAPAESCYTLPGKVSDYVFTGVPSVVAGRLAYQVTLAPGATVPAPTPYPIGNQCFGFSGERWDMKDNKPVSRTYGVGNVPVPVRDSDVLSRVARELATQGR